MFSNQYTPESQKRLNDLAAQVGMLSGSGDPRDLEQATKLLSEIDKIFNPSWSGTEGGLQEKGGLRLKQAFGTKPLGLQFSADGASIASVDGDGQLRMSKLAHFDLPGTVFQIGREISGVQPDCIGFGPDLQTMALGSYGKLYFLEFDKSQNLQVKIREDLGFDSKYTGIVFSHQNPSRLAVSRHDVLGNGLTGDYALEVYEVVHSGKRRQLDLCSFHKPRMGETVGDARYSEDCREVVFTSDKQVLHIPDSRGFMKMQAPTWVANLAVTPDKRTFALSPTGAWQAQTLDGMKITISACHNAQTYRLHGSVTQQSPARRMAFNYDGSKLAVADATDKITIYSIGQSRRALVISEEKVLAASGRVELLEFSRDGRLLACADDDRGLTLYQI